jgi:hypothetical protein
MEDLRKLRELACWCREFAEPAGNPAIWEARLRTARDLEREADGLEKVAAQERVRSRNRVVEQDRRSISDRPSSACCSGTESPTPQRNQGVHHEV